jgi:hypothetical protein
MRALVRLAAIGTLTASTVLVWSAPAAADIVTPAGACVGSAAWDAGGFAETSTQLTPDRVVEIPRADEVSWSGSVVGPADGSSRDVAGRVALALPPPFGSINLADWGGQATDVQRSGTYAYDLPSVVPSGVTLTLLASHDESGQRHCTATVGVIIPGGPFDSPLIWVALIGLLLVGAVLALLGRSADPSVGRIVGGALLGLPFGLFLGLLLVLFGAIPLASPVLTVLLVLGAVGGGVWTWRSPLAAKTTAALPV